jgi:hypothetical protein
MNSCRLDMSFSTVVDHKFGGAGPFSFHKYNWLCCFIEQCASGRIRRKGFVFDDAERCRHPPHIRVSGIDVLVRDEARQHVERSAILRIEHVGRHCRGIRELHLLCGSFFSERINPRLLHHPHWFFGDPPRSSAGCEAPPPEEIQLKENIASYRQPGPVLQVIGRLSACSRVVPTS